MDWTLLSRAKLNLISGARHNIKTSMPKYSHTGIYRETSIQIFFAKPNNANLRKFPNCAPQVGYSTYEYRP